MLSHWCFLSRVRLVSLLHVCDAVSVEMKRIADQ